jgi:predicted DNA-binding ribbon-helix-helix protein
VAEEKMRAFEFDGKRRGIRLDDATWQAVDWLAAQQGVKWAELAREWAGNASGSDDNLTRVIRAAAMNAMVTAAIFGEERGSDLAAMEANALTRRSSLFSDQQLDDFLANAMVQGESDQGGYTVIFGRNESSDDFLVIRNNMRDGLHFATLAPSERRGK